MAATVLAMWVEDVMPFDSVGNLQSLQHANGVTGQYQYDARNRLTNQVWRSVSTALAIFAYTVAPTGNRTALAETINFQPAPVSNTYNWAYDYLYRMTGENIGGTSSQSVAYGFDAVGNRTSRTSGATSQTLSYTPNDWLASDTYDNNGNTTGCSGSSYQYDVLDHLTGVNSGQIQITYDGDGNRVSKKVGSGPTTYYLVDDRNPSGYVQVLEEYQGTSLNKVYNYGLALISQRQVSGSTTNYYGTDGHGSTRLLMDAGGNITDTYTFDAYGLVISSSGSTPNNYLYCGQQWDSDLGFYYLRARYYKPDTGRFWTMDTYDGASEDPLSLHKYLYAQNNPVNRIDPSGHDDFSLAGEMTEIAVEAPIEEAEAAQGVMDVAAGEEVAESLEVSQANEAEQLELNLNFRGNAAQESEWETIYNNAANRGFSNTTMGRQAEGQLEARKILQQDWPKTKPEDWDFSKTSPGRTGVDVDYVGPAERNPGFNHVELKPYTKSAIGRFFTQIQRWALPQGDTRFTSTTPI